MNDSKPIDPSKNGRNDRGQFVPGWSGGPGRPAGSKLTYRKILTEVFDEAFFREAAEKLKAQALAGNGDIGVIERLMDRLVGKPGPDALVEELAEIAQQVDELRQQKGRAA